MFCCSWPETRCWPAMIFSCGWYFNRTAALVSRLICLGVRSSVTRAGLFAFRFALAFALGVGVPGVRFGLLDAFGLAAFGFGATDGAACRARMRAMACATLFMGLLTPLHGPGGVGIYVSLESPESD